MYHINSKEVKPDINGMYQTVKDLMHRGIRIKDCAKLSNSYIEKYEEIKSKIITEYGIENPGSPAQVARFLERKSREMDIAKRNDILNICFNSDTNKWTTDATALQKLSMLGYEFAQDILDFRHFKKYSESLLGFDKVKDANGFVHPEVSLSKTNRINYSSPALMNIPKKLLWYMVRPMNDGDALFSIDIKNQEPNILINLTGADELKPALTSPDGLYETIFKQCFVPTVTANVLIDTLPEDRMYSPDELKAIGTISPANYKSKLPDTKEVYYLGEKVIEIQTICIGSSKGVRPALPEYVYIATEDECVHKVNVTWGSYETKYKRANDYTVEGVLEGLEVRVSKVEREEFKRSWNAISYGAAFLRIQDICKTIDPKKVYNYITKIEALKKYRALAANYAKAGNSVVRTLFGTNLYAGETDDYKQLQRRLLDLPIQGTGADILSLLIKRFYDYTSANGLSDKLQLYYTRHDELIVEVNGDWMSSVGEDKVEAILRDMLEHQINDWVPFKIEVSNVTNSYALDVEEDDED